MGEYGIGVIGAGHFLPSKIETNQDLCKSLDVTPEWIKSKTGITKRYIAEDKDTASGFSILAAKRAIEMAGISNEEIDLIISCTFSHDYQFPALSAKIQKELKTNAQVFDIQANCAGFITGLTVASDRMRVDDSVKYALVIGVELQSRFIESKNVETSIFFSDGAGAVILGRVPKGEGIINSLFHADTSAYELVRLRGGGSSFPMIGRKITPEIDFMELNGLATWKQAITNLPISIRGVCDKANIPLKEIDLFLFHQANLNLIHYVLKKIRVDIKKTYTNIERIGNTGSASLAIVLSEAMQKGIIKKGQYVLMTAVGAGFIYGSSIWKWGKI